MKRSTIAKTLTIAAVSALALSIAPTASADDKGCSDASLQGTFAYTGTGFDTVPLSPVAEVGTQTFDGKGVTTGAATLDANGTYYQLTIKGTYTVNLDCTGTFTLQITFPPASGIGTVTLPVFFVIDDNGTEFRALEILLPPAPPGVITRIGRKQFPVGQ